ncbi:MAG TPA: hypothetical protein VEX86_04905 [Longimicrobium sp.]|nr:hypothetical protein [Longimicrobium sp.]
MSTTENEVGSSAHVEFEGDANEIYVGGRDVHVYKGKDEIFFRHTFRTLRMESAPLDTGEMAAELRTRRVLVLAGGYDDKATVARQVARRFAEWHGAPGYGPLPVLEWQRSSTFPELLLAFGKQTAPAVLLLVGIVPSDVRHDLSSVCAAAADAGHHVVVTTEIDRDRWLRHDVQAFWYELRPERMFDVEILAGELAHHLRLAETGLLRSADDPSASTVAGVPLEELAVRLGSPPNVLVFVQQLVAKATWGPVDAEAVWELAAGARKHDTRLEKWFHGVLNRDEQLLALCLSFFDGLFDDQLFAALERWVEHIRGRRDPSQRAFDYCDLDNLLTVFAQVEAGAAGTKFESRSPGNRAVLFRTAWRTHRRQILGALGVLTDLVVQSAYGRGNDWELYGSRGRRAHLRRVVGDALSDLGVISEAGVERALLRLASDGNAAVQDVAAWAVARWRQLGRDAELFRLLDRWQKDARIRAIVESLVEGREEKVRSPEANVRATVALAVGYAVEHDPPNQLTEPLIVLIRELAADRHKAVRRRFAGVTLPRAVAAHPRQLRTLLSVIAAWDLEEDVALALAYAAHTRPADIAGTLAEWHGRVDELRTDTVDPGRVGVRETLLRVLAYTYGELDYDTAGAPVSAEEAFQRLSAILAAESHPAVRDAVVDAMIRQARERFERVEPLLQPLMGGVSPPEQDDVVRRLTGLYLDQRERLEGADAEVEVGRRTFPAFVGQARPLTPVERAMMRWMRDPRHPAAQRIGIRASVAFVEALDGPESGEVARIAAARTARGGNDGGFRISSAPPRHGPPEPGWYTGTFVPWLATIDAPEYRPVVGGLLPTALEQNTTRPQALGFALNRWRGMRGDTAVTTTAERLRGAIDLHASEWVALIAGGLLLLFFLLAFLL